MVSERGVERWEDFDGCVCFRCSHENPLFTLHVHVCIRVTALHQRFV